ncbi:hypothetical protein D0T84_14050 [Dysgonomonas sp. 521]|nr:hypothetical protein [Dysgonomonas sp. 521]
MENEKENLTIKQKYDKLEKKKKTEVRNLFLAKFEYQYSSFYNKLNSDNFKTVEREYLHRIL